ncbi:MAG: sugar ABC transporter permease [Myxococcales bacterium]|nr:sugar ABC transporter permease [Myxococcales bacterium]
MSDRAARERGLGLLLGLPALVAMLSMVGYPLFEAVRLSLYNYRITDPGARSFVGLDNYRVVLTDALFWSDMTTTLLLTVSTVVVELVLGFAFAMVMHRIVIGRGLVRTALLVPYGIVTVVSSFAWRYAFALDSGFVNGWLGLADFSWFGRRESSLLVIAVSEIWKTTPFVSLLLLAGLVQVPEDLYDAAKVDGASAWQRFVKVTLPCTRNALLVAILFRTLDAFRIFDNVFVMTSGAHGTESVSFLAYRQMIGRTALGLGSAVAVVTFLAALLLAGSLLLVGKPDLDQAER